MFLLCVKFTRDNEFCQMYRVFLRGQMLNFKKMDLYKVLLIGKILLLVDRLVNYSKKTGCLTSFEGEKMSGVRYLLSPMTGLAGDLGELSFFEVFEDFAVDFLRHGDHEARDVFAGVFV